MARAEQGVCEVRSFDSAKVESVKEKLLPQELLQRAADAFKVLGHPNRLRALEALDGMELCVCDVSAALDLSMSGTSQILRELRRLGAVEYRTSGKFAYYTLAHPFWLETARSVLNHMGADKLERSSVA
ncbi:MAG: hypothetical protein AMXMBFR13_14940 [Phycisphaerae bacterium]